MRQLTEHMTNGYCPDPLELREVGNGRWQLLRDFRFFDPEEGVICVPKGAITDLYSVPKVVRSLVSKVQETNAPAVIHDWAYRAQLFPEKGKSRADAVLNRAMKLHWSPVPWWKRQKIIVGLKLGGWIAYRKASARYRQLTYIIGRTPTEQEIIESTMP